MKKNIYFPLSILINILLIEILFNNQIYHKRKETVLRNNYAVIAAGTQAIKYYKTQNKQLAATVDALILDKKQIKQEYDEKLKNLKIKARHVENISETEITGTTNLVVPIILMDSNKLKKIIDTSFYDSLFNKAYEFNYNDDFNSIKGIIFDNKILQQQIKRKIRLFWVLHKGERYKPNWWIFSRRKDQITIYSSNPTDSVTYEKFVKRAK